MSKVTYPLATIVIILGLAVFGSHSVSAQQTFTKTSSADVAIDIMSCAGASEGLGKYEEYSTDQRTYSKELCDYLMQKYDIQCNNFELDANLCAKESYSYIKIQGYLQREGLINIAYNNGVQVIEKTVKVEVEEEDDNDNDNDRNHKHRDRHWDKDRDRGRDLPPCNEVKYGTHCDGSEDEDSWTDEDDKEQEEDQEEEKEEEEEPEQEEEEEDEEPVIRHG